MNAVYTVRDIATRIVDERPSAPVRVRLLRDVLDRPVDDPALCQARRELARHRGVRVLRDQQWSDGSWGRLHSRDSCAGQRIPTTEVGVARALALGLGVDDPLLRRASRYLAGVLDGTVIYRDPPERNDRWPVGVQLFAASTLAQIEPQHPGLGPVWALWAAIARRTLASGDYDAEAEVRAHRELTGASVRDSYLVLSNRYALMLLGSRADALPPVVEAALVRWVWRRPEGIGYLSVPLWQPPEVGHASPMDRWLASLEVLARFPTWSAVAGEAVCWLWAHRTPEGLWDLGPRPTASAILPLSETWRRKGARQHDWSTRVLVLLRRYYQSAAHPAPR